MNEVTIQQINSIVFMEKLNLFAKPDVILFHPGHFPELNKQLLDYYHQFDAKLIMIPSVFNTFLNSSEYDYYRPLLMREGVEKEKLKAIPPNSINGVEGVIQSAFQYINESTNQNILLAGKSFFSRRFYLLSSLYAKQGKIIDVLPLVDDRKITPTSWMKSEKGRARVLNEVEQYGNIIRKQLNVL
ncbi:hypothetical protein HNQ94_003834 [Salirhabdus euzebyi]|uniref:Uncharacterized protein n=1 Tax=Salirhabdus euzebyi TaxID=394506 RepID=A0A841QAM1_9BACI|nr:hypothetical protein [Salirhabdus euzebyi]MBB6455334.1 hypothetical protein [Salirhabdus euzebyi]